MSLVGCHHEMVGELPGCFRAERDAGIRGSPVPAELDGDARWSLDVMAELS
jgi:hypothetical protein